MNAVASREEHRAFLNRYYGSVRRVYDVTRKYYLFGRDRALAELADEYRRGEWHTLVEVGSGTGRNLKWLHARCDGAVLGALDACDEMLEYLAARCPWAHASFGFAEDADVTRVLGREPDRILLSYCLSMIPARREVLEHLQASLAPGGALVVVDFLAASRPGLLRRAFERWLEAFHVTPVGAAVFGAEAQVRTGPLDYYVLARLPAAAS